MARNDLFCIACERRFRRRWDKKKRPPAARSQNSGPNGRDLEPAPPPGGGADAAAMAAATAAARASIRPVPDALRQTHTHMSTDATTTPIVDTLTCQHSGGMVVALAGAPSTPPSERVCGDQQNASVGGSAAAPLHGGGADAAAMAAATAAARASIRITFADAQRRTATHMTNDATTNPIVDTLTCQHSGGMVVALADAPSTPPSERVCGDQQNASVGGSAVHTITSVARRLVGWGGCRLQRAGCPCSR